MFSSAEVSTPRPCSRSPRTRDSLPHALSFRYGQRHEAELEAAARVAEAIGVEAHVVANIDLSMFGGSALTDAIDVPKQRSDAEMAEGIPVTYVPARNTVFLSIALAWAEVLEAEDVFIGVNALDYSGYPDCRPEYIAAFEQMANLATKAAVEGTTATSHPRSAHRSHEGADHRARSRTRRRLRPHAQLLRPRQRRTRLRHVRLLRRCGARAFVKRASRIPTVYQERFEAVA